MFKVAVACALLSLTVVNAECPNGCSGRGSCTSKDMCVCYKNFQGNDCSERTCGFGFAHTDTPKGDLDMDGDLKSTDVTTPVYVYTTDEWYNGDAQSEEGHFYMECSNQGLCDRETGDCVCFDGFEGSACQRASCPNSCSGHGSCESISEFASTAGGSLFTKGLTTGDTTYDLWDAKVGYGCRCDPWFTGADCSLRSCKVGVDPMYYDTEQVTYETIVIDLGKGSAIATGDYIRIKFWDYWGESYITNRIDDPDAAAIEAALEALPNGVISSDLECTDLTTDVADNTFFPITATIAANGRSILCQFKSNPGALRLAEIDSYSGVTSASIIGTPLRGEDENLCSTLATDTVTAITESTGVHTLTRSGTTTTLPSTPFLIKVLDQYAVVSTVSTTTLTLVTGIKTGTGATSGLSYDLYYSTTSLTDAIDMASFTSNAITYNGNPSFVAGDKIICENQVLNVQGVSSAVATVDRKFFGSALTHAANPTTNCYKIPSSTSKTAYVSECSARGICDRESGVCTCFKGYTNDNCDKQSILAF